MNRAGDIGKHERDKTMPLFIVFILAIGAVLLLGKIDADDKHARKYPYNTTVELPNGSIVTGKPMRY